jgi:pimeloyl-ACP methyl ester carboxylesterase
MFLAHSLTSTPRRLAAIATVAVAVVALTACTPERNQVTPSGTPSPAPTAGLDVYDQEIAWEDCGELECGSVRVPLDWTNPTGETIELRVNRLPATGDPIGSLLINPGGPGGSGLDLTEYFGSMAGEDLLAAYDVVGFDPRGVGTSTPMNCGDASVVDEYYITDWPMDSQADIDAAVQRNEEFGALCRENSGAVVENMDTPSAARDMDVLRAVLGDEKLNFLGFSYGTQLGATYAQLYPQNVGRLVLDGAVDFLISEQEQGVGQARGFEKSLRNYIEWCHDENGCPLDPDPETARQQIHDVAFDAIANPLQGANGDVNGNLMVYGIVVTLYDEASWPYLSLALDEAIDDGTATIMGELADFYLDRDGAAGEYLSNSTIAFTGVACLDSDPNDTFAEADLRDMQAAMDEASPTFGWWFSAYTGCNGWPFAAHERITTLDATLDAAPILVIGTTNDPATPYEWAESLTERLGHATLLTYDGEGHTAYGRSNECIIEAVDGFLVDGVMPDSGTVC